MTAGELLGTTGLGEVRLIPVGRIKPYEKNPRKIPQKAVEQVAHSIREFNWQQPIVVDSDLTIVIGHTRFLAAKQLGETEVPVIVETRLTDEQVRALRIADNRTNSYSTWDIPLLIREVEGLDGYDSLDLADWRTIIEGFEQGQEEAELDLDDEVGQIIADTYNLVVTFDSRENAERAAAEILALPGAVNVRYSGG